MEEEQKGDQLRGKAVVQAGSVKWPRLVMGEERGGQVTGG